MLTGNGHSHITNDAGATINGDIVSNGASPDTVDNIGLINNAIRLGAGDDVVINRVGAAVNFNPLTVTRNDINGVTDTGAGADQFFMLGGTTTTKSCSVPTMTQRNFGRHHHAVGSRTGRQRHAAVDRRQHRRPDDGAGPTRDIPEPDTDKPDLRRPVDGGTGQ